MLVFGKKLNVVDMMISVFDRVENIVRKREIAGFQLSSSMQKYFEV